MAENGDSVPLTDHESEAQVVTTATELATPEIKECRKAEDGGEIEFLGMFFLVQSMAHMETATSPGIVVNPEIAKSSPCRCAVLDSSELCFSRGIVGAMDEGQKQLYCQPKTYFESPGLQERLKKFKEAVAAAQERIKDIPKGERLEPWLSVMSEELEKRGIAV